VQLCYAKNGTEILGHALEGFRELAPADTFVACDTYNMYNESLRTPTFEALHEHDPACKPVYRMLYGHAADIYLDRTDNGSMVRLSIDEVCQRASRIGLADDLIDPADPDESIARAFQSDHMPPIFDSIVKAGGEVLSSVVTLFLISTRGWHQGCALATHGACMPYHIVLAKLQAEPAFRRNRCLAFGDDTYGHGEGGSIFAWRAEKESRCEALGHRARREKELTYSPQGTLEHAPPDMPGSPQYGRVQGFKAAGFYVGEADWVRRQLVQKAASLLAPLDRVDQMVDVGDVENSAQIKHAVVTHTTSGMPNHWLRGQRTLYTTVAPAQLPGDASPPISMTDYFDRRSAASFELMVDATASPPDRRARAIMQARLPVKLGGAGILNTTSIAAAVHTASLLACWGRMHAWFPIFASVDVLQDPCTWLCELRTEYESLRTRRRAISSTYSEYAKDLVHYCDGATVRPRFRPKDLASAASVPPLELIFDSASKKPPAQRQLASIGYHEDWLVCVAANQAADAAALADGVAARRHREATRMIDVAQPYAGAFMCALPTSPACRYKSVHWVWAMQRRFGLYVSAAVPTFELLAAQGDGSHDSLGDTLSHAPTTDKSAPHDAALRVWHDAHQATATGAVILGDKEKPELYTIYNDGCIVDLAEEGMGKGGGDLCVEVKVYSSFVPRGASSPHETSYHGDTHAFGNTEERLIRAVLGVAAQEGNAAWDSSTGLGTVAAHKGDYHDAIHVKRNTVELRLHNIFGGFNRGATRALHALSKRATDRTAYESWAAPGFQPYWGQRISASIVMTDAKRCLHAVSAMRAKARGAAAAPRAAPRPTPRG
jgi:hypothetical protein